MAKKRKPPTTAAAMTVRDVAASLRVRDDTVKKWIRSGELRAVNVGTKSRPRYRIEPADLDAFKTLRSNTKPTRRTKPNLTPGNRFTDKLRRTKRNTRDR